MRPASSPDRPALLDEMLDEEPVREAQALETGRMQTALHLVVEGVAGEQRSQAEIQIGFFDGALRHRG